MEVTSRDFKKRVAVLIPCYNEGSTIASVVRDLRAQLPDADIYVYDNNSTDDTVEEARKAGAIIRYETRQGKGNVMRSMFRDIDADVYVMVDGDATYPIEKVHELIEPVAANKADMVVGSRLHSESRSSFKKLNLIGNRLFVFLLNWIFKLSLTDFLSGYRAFNKAVASIPILSRGFDIETELTLKTIEHDYRVKEVPVTLAPRPEGSKSKIKIASDGLLIFNTILALFRDYKPLTAFGALGLLLMLCGLIPGTIIIIGLITSGEVQNMPLAILSMGIILSGLFVAFTGLILHTISRRFQELDYQMQNLTARMQGRHKENRGE